MTTPDSPRPPTAPEWGEDQPDRADEPQETKAGPSRPEWPYGAVACSFGLSGGSIALLIGVILRDPGRFLLAGVIVGFLSGLMVEGATRRTR